MLLLQENLDRIGGVMVSVLDSSAINRGFELRSGQTKEYKIGTCCFSAKHTTLKRTSKDWLAQSQDNVSEWSDMSTRGLLFQFQKSTQCMGLVQSDHHHHHHHHLIKI